MPSTSTARRPLEGSRSSSTSSFTDSTTPRLYAECGAAGVTSSASTDGLVIGPPAEKLYAVEPVGVATMTASAA